MEWEKTQKSPHNIDEDQAGGLTLSDFKTYYEAMVFKNITEKQISETDQEVQKQTQTNIINQSLTKKQSIQR